MEDNKKKKIKRIFITLFSLLIIFGIAFLGYSLITSSNNQNNQQSEEPQGPSRFFLAQTAIFNNEYSQNYTGVYKFSRINYIYLSKFSEEGLNKIYNYYNVDDTMSLISKLTNMKNTEISSTNESLVIDDGRFQFNHNQKPQTIGTIFGNDDLSYMFDDSNRIMYNASLTNLSQQELESLTEKDQINYHGTELYLTKTIDIEIDKATYSFDLIYVYNLIN